MSDRPSESRRQSASSRLSNLAAATLLLVATASVSAVTALSAINNSDETKTAAHGQRADHLVAITAVKPGHERLSLTARLSDEGIDPLKDVVWKITDRLGGIVFEGKAEAADALVQPGDYLVEALYEKITYREVIAVHQGNEVSVSFILNIGGLRILPTVAHVTTFPPASTTKIFALDGLNRGQLVTSSKLPGEIIKVQAGRYRLESEFDLGNAVAVTDVTVKPGIMSAVHVAHKAGSVKLEVVGAAARPVRWSFASGDGMYVPTTDSASTELIMKPGNYTVIADVDGVVIERTFDLEAGQSITLKLQAE